ncbi:MAG: chemotaxis protein CheX [Candidatus Muirbacterium halophilum]|nr:chemotaxis protein CheX [Candidatus Muirbacterium halophilum]
MLNSNEIDILFDEVLEESTFLFADKVKKEEISQYSHENFLITYISFDGEVCGELFLLFSEETAHEITMNMLGEDENNFSDFEVKDAVKEFANMLCGKIVLKEFGKEKEFDISIPIINEAPHEIYKRLIEDEKTRFYMIDERPALFNIGIVKT